MSSEPEPEFPPECVDGTTLSTGRFMRCFNTSVTSSGGFTTEEIAENRNKYVNGQPNKNNQTSNSSYATAARTTAGRYKRICSDPKFVSGEFLPEHSGIGRRMNQSGKNGGGT